MSFQREFVILHGQTRFPTIRAVEEIWVLVLFYKL